MELKKILSGIEGLKAKGNLDLDISNLESDSRKVTEGTLFVAIKGFETDGHKYIKDYEQTAVPKDNLSCFDKFHAQIGQTSPTRTPLPRNVTGVSVRRRDDAVPIGRRRSRRCTRRPTS